MIHARQRSWRDPLITRSLYLLTNESFQTATVHELDAGGKSVKTHPHILEDRVGDCWAKGRLKPGDILLCDELTGDCFYNWYLIDYTNFSNKEGVHMKLVPYPFGAYSMESIKLEGFTQRDYGLLLAGERVEVMTKLPD